MSRTIRGTQTGTVSVEGLTESERHRLLAADRRRLALDILASQTTPVTLEALAAEIAVHEDGIESDDDDAVARVATTLHHAHLPKMADMGVLDYHEQTHRVEIAGHHR